ncbi:MAG TPA: hypothetical protein VFV70_07770 [Hyphomonadaceae bacterium]|nr:hypothetical protein [Hyphomonadaceae bacterium]
MIDPRDVAGRVPSCPRCGEKHYTYVMAAGPPPKVEKIRCAHCGANILRAYRSAQPTFFGLTIGKLDRLALLTGVALLVLLAVRLFFVR